MKKKTCPQTVTHEAESDGGLINELIARSLPAGPGAGPVLGRLADRDDQGAPLVDYPGNPGSGPLPALTLADLAAVPQGAELALLFLGGDPRRPLVLGVVQGPSTVPVADVDGDCLVLEGKERVELRCGQARIVLTSDGKVLVKGTDVLSRSSGPNRLKGASIQLN